MAASVSFSRFRFANLAPFSVRFMSKSRPPKKLFNYTETLAAFKKSQVTVIASEHESEYSETPEYPALFDTSPHGRARRRRQIFYDKIRELPTVQEKLAEICLSEEVHNLYGRQRKQTFDVFVMTDCDAKYNLLPFHLFATRTSLKEGLPDVYNRMNVDALAEHIKPNVLAAIVDTFEGLVEKDPPKDYEWPSAILRREDKLRGEMMSNHIVRAVMTILSSQLPHLRDCQVDYNARCDAYWLSGGFAPTERVRSARRGIRKGREGFTYAVTPEDAPVDAKLQYIARPHLQFRHTQPLPPFLDRDDPLCTTYDVPEYKYQAESAGLRKSVRCPTNVPGFWPGDPYGFGSLAVYTSHQLRKNCSLFGEECLKDGLHSNGVVASFGWLVALANFKGFSAYQELTYPLATQTVLTNGKHWSFYAYQLNTMSLNLDFYTKQYQNICWTTNGMKLFDTVENGKVLGYNDEVVKLFIKFLVHAPQEREGVNLTPYLRPVEHARDDPAWRELNQKFKTCYANRRFKIPYGPRLWETIYKVKFNTRLDKHN